MYCNYHSFEIDTTIWRSSHSFIEPYWVPDSLQRILSGRIFFWHFRIESSRVDVCSRLIHSSANTTLVNNRFLCNTFQMRTHWQDWWTITYASMHTWSLSVLFSSSWYMRGEKRRLRGFSRANWPGRLAGFAWCFDDLPSMCWSNIVSRIGIVRVRSIERQENNSIWSERLWTWQRWIMIHLKRRRATEFEHRRDRVSF